MWLRWMVAALHLLALGVGLGAVWARGRALRGELDAQGLQRVFYADTLWGIAAGIWIATGLARAFAGLEKGSAYYLHNHAFWVKMTLLGLVLLLEVSPMAVADPLAQPLRPWGGGRHAARWRLRRHKCGPGGSRDCYGICGYGDGTRYRILTEGTRLAGSPSATWNAPTDLP